MTLKRRVKRFFRRPWWALGVVFLCALASVPLTGAIGWVMQGAAAVFVAVTILFFIPPWWKETMCSHFVCKHCDKEVHSDRPTKDCLTAAASKVADVIMYVPGLQCNCCLQYSCYYIPPGQDWE